MTESMILLKYVQDMCGRILTDRRKHRKIVNPTNDMIILILYTSIKSVLDQKRQSRKYWQGPVAEKGRSRGQRPCPWAGGGTGQKLHPWGRAETRGHVHGRRSRDPRPGPWGRAYTHTGRANHRPCPLGRPVTRGHTHGAG